ncbi:MAG: DUF5675 family protein [Tannerellaceae bacterium]|jgi:hypothetical protein|nr:DUF5675 family protein [Tannerellaceae bacterium]
MRKIKLIRIAKKPLYTIGKLYIDGEYFCDTLEDTVRDLSKEAKIAGKTAIPAGTYEVAVNRSPKFGRNLPRLLNVPCFEGVLIHRGNKPEDTAGCILVGENKVVGGLINSTKYELALTEKIQRAGGAVIEIVTSYE